MHVGIIAVKAEVAQLLEAFALSWPRHEPIARNSLVGLEALDGWMRATQRQGVARAGTSAHRSIDTFGFWQDGEWAVLRDPSYALASDRQALATLSERFGLALSFVIETSGGCAFFDAYGQGQPLRRIQSIDGRLATEGARLPQEAGLAETRFYMEEIEQLLLAFGLTPPQRLPADWPVTGAAYIDGTDYAALKPARPAKAAGAAAARPRRPWWRFW
jgi:hypothetical protein